MAKAVTITRHAADDRRGPANLSPFRSKSEETRYAAALDMVAKREEELAGLREIHARVSDRQTQRILAQRILATRNNLRSWEDYVAKHAPREPRAVIHPTPIKPARKSRARKAA
jgi:hypothetical protein